MMMPAAASFTACGPRLPAVNALVSLLTTWLQCAALVRISTGCGLLTA